MVVLSRFILLHSESIHLQRCSVTKSIKVEEEMIISLSVRLANPLSSQFNPSYQNWNGNSIVMPIRLVVDQQAMSSRA